MGKTRVDIAFNILWHLWSFDIEFFRLNVLSGDVPGLRTNQRAEALIR